MSDTPPEIQRKVAELYLSLSAEERVKRSMSLIAAGRFYAERAVLRRDPSLSGIDLRIAVFRWTYQNESCKEFLDAADVELRKRNTQRNPLSTAFPES